MSSITALQSTLSSGINAVQKSIQTVQTQLATNKKDLDPGQLGQVTRLASQVTGYNSAVQNIAQARSSINVAQTGLSAIRDLMSQLTDLANKAASGSLNADDRTNLNKTYTSLIDQIDSIAENAGVNDVNLISGSTNLVVQTGLTSADTLEVEVADSTVNGLNSGGFGSIDSDINAQAAIGLLKDGLSQLSINQSSLAAFDAGLVAKSKTDASIATNLQGAIDAIEKPDQAALQMQLTQFNNQQSIDYYLISQMNTASQAALTIFR
jgi:flagellin-like hook-associated protein FlgL